MKVKIYVSTFSYSTDDHGVLATTLKPSNSAHEDEQRYVVEVELPDRMEKVEPKKITTTSVTVGISPEIENKPYGLPRDS